jgi:hypothetical protein
MSSAFSIFDKFSENPQKTLSFSWTLYKTLCVQIQKAPGEVSGDGQLLSRLHTAAEPHVLLS